jgi:type I restriction enzyme S subunit
MAGELQTAVLRDLLITTKDGDWGRETPATGYIACRVIRGTDFPSARIGKIDAVPKRYLDEGTVHRRLLEPDDILLETAGGAPGRPTGRSLLITGRLLADLGLPSTCASFARFLRIDRTKANPRYIFWLLQNLYAAGHMEGHQVQHTGVARFQFTRFAQTEKFSLPPPYEQDTIAELLGSLDDKIELNRRMAETLEATARALFKRWFVDFDPVHAKADDRTADLADDLVASFPDSFDAEGLPNGWRRTAIVESFELTGGGTPKTSVPEYWNGGVPWFSVVDAPIEAIPFVLKTERSITEVGLANCASPLLPVGATIISARGTVGKLAIVGTPMAINQSCYAAIPKAGYSDYFVYFLLKNAIEDLKTKSHGSVFNTITRRIRTQLQQSMVLADLRDMLLPKLISGELRIADAEKQIAVA